MKKELCTPAAIEIRVRDFRKYVAQAFQVKEKDPLHVTWKDIETKLLTILEESKQRPQVTVALVGGTGAGKSTLINAILGAPLLPTGSVKATTAAVCQVSYSDRTDYEATVEFISREDWNQELSALADDLQERADSEDPEAKGGMAEIAINQAARNKLHAIYGSVPDAELLAIVKGASSEPAEVQEAFRVGTVEVTSSDLKDFQKKIATYLDSKHRLWPIVKRVHIRGRFDKLQNGASLVDLPGINDPNDAREAVTREYLKTCRFVWIIYNIKRALTRDSIHLLQSDDFQRQIVMDGRVGALTFVGTASDDIDIDNPEEFGLPEGAPAIDIIHARNYAAKVEIQRQLQELTEQLVHRTGEDPHNGQLIEAAFKKSSLFMITARFYLKLLHPHPQHVLLDGLTISDTQVPSLIGHLENTCKAFGVEAKCEAHQNQIDVIWREFYREVQIQKTFAEKRNELSQKQQKEMEGKATSARTFLEGELKSCHEVYCQKLQGKSELLEERLKRAIDRGHRQLGDICGSWRGIHHATLGAIARRGGRHHGTSGAHDLPADICKPILDSLAFAWAEYFSDVLVQSLERANIQLLTIAADHKTVIQQILLMIEDADPALHARLTDIVQTTQKILEQRLSTAKNETIQKIEQKQRELYGVIHAQVRENMKAGFSLAAQERGTGMKKRMINVISEHATAISQTMFEDIQSGLLDAVASLIDWMQRQHAEMVGTVRNQSDIATTNLTADVHARSMVEIEARRALIQDLQKTLLELGAPYYLGVGNSIPDLAVLMMKGVA